MFDKAEWQRQDRASNRERERLRSSTRYYADVVKSRDWARRKRWKQAGVLIETIVFPELTVCSICAREGKMHMDHDHQTGKFRGWICAQCNKALGLFQDSPELLFKAADYLRARSS